MYVGAMFIVNLATLGHAIVARSESWGIGEDWEYVGGYRVTTLPPATFIIYG